MPSTVGLHSATGYYRTIGKTPVFNTPDLSQVFTYPMRWDPKNLAHGSRLNRAIETGLHRGVLVKEVAWAGKDVVQIETNEYPSKTPIYTHRLFLRPTEDTTLRKIECPPLEEILKKLQNWGRKRIDYIWGGTFHNGIHRLAKLYSLPTGPKSKHEKEDWEMTRKVWLQQGVDCTGLLYELTNGFTPRNSSDLVYFGEPVVGIEGKTDAEIAALLLPGDIIALGGHLFIIEGKTIVDCRERNDTKGDLGGFIRMDLLERLKDIRNRGRTALDKPPQRDQLFARKDYFVIRRWHPEVLKSQSGNQTA